MHRKMPERCIQKKNSSLKTTTKNGLMKKILLIPFLLSFHFAYAGTGSANDEMLFLLVICAFLLLILALITSVEFITRMIKHHREKKITDTALDTNTGNIG